MLARPGVKQQERSALFSGSAGQRSDPLPFGDFVASENLAIAWATR